MIGAIIGTAAKAAVTGAAGLAVVGLLRESGVGDTLRNVAVTVAEVGVRGVKLVEVSAEKVATVATEVFKEAKQRVDVSEDAESADDAAAAVVRAAEEAARGTNEEQA